LALNLLIAGVVHMARWYIKFWIRRVSCLNWELVSGMDYTSEK